MALFARKFESAKQEWATPQDFFDPLNREFSFTLDVAADETNHKCPSYLSAETDGLASDWGENICWMNPPYKQVGKWVKKAFQASVDGATVVCLIPARTNTSWWHEYCMSGEVRFVRGRPAFGDAKHGLPQPLAVVVFRPDGEGSGTMTYYDWKTSK